MQIWNANTNMTYCISSTQDSSKKGHFRVVSSFCFKARLSAKPLIRKLLFRLVQIKLIFTRKSRKVCTQPRFESEDFGTRKWSIGAEEMPDTIKQHSPFLKFCPEFLTCILASHANVLLARHAILPRRKVEQEHVTHPYERLHRRLPASRRFVVVVREKRQQRRKKETPDTSMINLLFKLSAGPGCLK